MADFETFKRKPKKGGYQKKESFSNKDNGDFISIFTDLGNSINYKIAMFLFIVGVLIFSDTFIELFLVPIPGATYMDNPTTKGTTIQLLALTFGYIIIDLLVTGQII